MKLIIFSLLLTLNIFSQPLTKTAIDPTRLIVKLKINAKAPKVHNAYGIKQLFGQYVIYATKDIEALKEELYENPAIDSMAYNKKWGNIRWPQRTNPLSIRIDSNPPMEPSPFNDPMSKKLWGLAETTQGINLFKHVEYVEQHQIQKVPVIVAVVDTGVDVNHEDLKGKIWINTKEIANNNIDDDKNGYVDDVNGIDTLTRDSQGRATAHRFDGHGHGTHVSGTIAAIQNNNIGISGISSHAQIMAIRTVPADGDETDVDVAESFIYAAKMGAKVINCSFGKSNEEVPGLVKDAITEIEKINQTLVIAASGNDSQNIDEDFKLPASLPNQNLLVVDAIRRGGSLAMFSNFGIKNTDVGAPGVAILSTTPKNTYASWDGTSMATPHVVGVAAEILSIFPKLTAMQLKDILVKSVKLQSSLKNRSSSGGSIDVNNARELAQTLITSNRLRINQRNTQNTGFQGQRN